MFIVYTTANVDFIQAALKWGTCHEVFVVGRGNSPCQLLDIKNQITGQKLPQFSLFALDQEPLQLNSPPHFQPVL